MTQLKLMAVDGKDLEIISSYCQDSVLKIGDIEYLASAKKFALAINRYAWEEQSISQRHKAILEFSRVNSVKVQGIDPKQKDMVLSLLAILFTSEDEPEGTIELVFAGDGAIRLNVECVEAQLSDLPAAWKAKSRPAHS